jgi:glycosyltransferase involved in cell wall biosynthesis
MERPLVSVLIPAFNAGPWIRAAIDSCLHQTYSPIEIVVVDDGSTDDTQETLRSYGGRIRWEATSHRGANHARNRALQMAAGQYVQLLDADDYLLPSKIGSHLSVADRTGADIVCGDVYEEHYSDDGGTRLESRRVPGIDQNGQTDYLAVALGIGCMPCHAYLIRKSLIDEAGGWDENLAAGQNRDVLLSLLIDNATFAYAEGCTAVYRRGHSRRTVSTDRTRLAYCFARVSMKAERRLRARQRLSARYLEAVANSYWRRAKLDRRVLTLRCLAWLVFLAAETHTRCFIHRAMDFISGMDRRGERR